MKFTLATIALLASSAIATPWGKGGWDYDHHNWNGKKDKECDKKYEDKMIFDFDYVYKVVATPDQVRNGTTPVPGQPGAVGYYNFGINVAANTICYNITLFGVTGAYQSPALTATHIHEAARGASGPPRLAFPNPVGDDNKRISYGCLTGPFKTGIVNATTGIDSGDGFNVGKIVANPGGFFCDVHTTRYTLGAVRGQLA